MAMGKSTGKYKDNMVPEPPLSSETERPEKIGDDPEHGTCAPETKDLPRAITG
jgi:hypothetical protein